MIAQAAFSPAAPAVSSTSSRMPLYRPLRLQPTSSCGASAQQQPAPALRTCRNCKRQYDPSENHLSACQYHPAHFGGETKRKFESVYTGGTMDTPGSGQIVQYWHCCGNRDTFSIGCQTSPHISYDD